MAASVMYERQLDSVWDFFHNFQKELKGLYKKVRCMNSFQLLLDSKVPERDKTLLRLFSYETSEREGLQREIDKHIKFYGEVKSAIRQVGSDDKGSERAVNEILEKLTIMLGESISKVVDSNSRTLVRMHQDFVEKYQLFEYKIKEVKTILLLKQDKQRIQDENDELRKQNRAIQDENDELRKQNRAIRNANDELREQNQTIRDENRNIKEDNQDIRREMLETQKQNEELKSKMQQLEEEKESLNREIERLQDENNELKQQIEVLWEENEKLKREMKEIREENEKLKREMKEMREENQKKFNELETQQREGSENLTELTEKVNRLMEANDLHVIRQQELMQENRQLWLSWNERGGFHGSPSEFNNRLVQHPGFISTLS